MALQIGKGCVPLPAASSPHALRVSLGLPLGLPRGVVLSEAWLRFCDAEETAR